MTRYLVRLFWRRITKALRCARHAGCFSLSASKRDLLCIDHGSGADSRLIAHCAGSPHFDALWGPSTCGVSDTLLEILS
jgi:hypothetical protein